MQSSSGRSGCVSLEVWGGWLVSIVSAILGAVLAAFLSGREIAGLRKELATKELKLEEQARRLEAANEHGRLQADALTAARLELQQLRDAIRRNQTAGGTDIDEPAVATLRCSQRQRQLPDPNFSPEHGVNVVTVFVPAQGCWSEILQPPVGYRYWALHSSTAIQLGTSAKMSLPAGLMPSPEGLIESIITGHVSDMITPRPVEAGQRVEFGNQLLGQNVPVAIRLRNNGQQMAMVTFLLQPE